jgi:hypothetical protein
LQCFSSHQVCCIWCLTPPCIAVKGLLYFAAHDNNAIQLIEKSAEWSTGLHPICEKILDGTFYFWAGILICETYCTLSIKIPKEVEIRPLFVYDKMAGVI